MKKSALTALFFLGGRKPPFRDIGGRPPWRETSALAQYELL
jgi:hypothetical protein